MDNPSDISRIPTGGVIRKLTVGGFKDEGITYLVGKQFRDGKTITKITRSENDLMLYGAIAYYIYVKVGEDEKLWKIIERQPVTLEYDLSV